MQDRLPRSVESFPTPFVILQPKLLLQFVMHIGIAMFADL